MKNLTGLRSTFILSILLFSGFSLFAQQKKTVLFLGNSYTDVNNLPVLTANIALSLGDTLIHDKNTPGGYTFEGHSTNATSLAKIQAQSWDYVVLQEQSQRPSFPPAQVQTDVYPFADTLVRRIKENDSCSVPLFYMTWGRKNGDAGNCGVYPPLCTYEGMQWRLRLSYLEMGSMHNTPVAPVGMVWQAVRDSFPGIELYNPDESHPSLHGSYLAACTFYAAIFHRSPVGASYPNGITMGDARSIQTTVARVVFDSLEIWGIDTTTVQASFTYTQDSLGTVSFVNTSSNADDQLWFTGNGDSTFAVNLHYTYTVAGTYQVTLIARKACIFDTTTQTITVVIDSLTSTSTDHVAASFSVYPNPSNGTINIESQMPEAKVFIVTLSGVTIFEGTLGGLLRTSLPPGCYFVVLSAFEGTRVKKVLITE